MNGPETILKNLGAEDSWNEIHGLLWLDAASLGIRKIASTMHEAGARFVTITAYELPKDTGMRFEYHWDLEGQLFGYFMVTASKQMESIVDICEAADWIEREVHEEYGIEFSGREYVPLLLKAGFSGGLNLREVKP